MNFYHLMWTRGDCPGVWVRQSCRQVRHICDELFNASELAIESQNLNEGKATLSRVVLSESIEGAWDTIKIDYEGLWR